jgi:hypothetical protein
MQIFMKTLTGKTSSLLPVGFTSDQFPTRGTLARQVSASHEKSPPRTTSLRLARRVWLRLVRGPGCTTRATPPTHMEERISTSRKIQQLAAMQEARPAKSLNASLAGCAAITLPSSPTTKRKLGPRHSSTLYDTLEPRLSLGHGKLGKCSGRPKQAQTTWGKGQVSRSEEPSPATRRLPRQGITTWLQCTLADRDVRQDV